MDIFLKNVNKKDFLIFKLLVKFFGFEIVEEVEKLYNLEFVKEILDVE